MAVLDVHIVAHIKGGEHHLRLGLVKGVAILFAYKTGSAKVRGACDG